MVTSVSSCTAHCLLRLQINRRRECCAPFWCHPLARQRLSTGLIMSSISPPYFLPPSFVPSFQTIALKHHSLVDARDERSFARAIRWTDQPNAEAEIFGENWHFSCRDNFSCLLPHRFIKEQTLVQAQPILATFQNNQAVFGENKHWCPAASSPPSAPQSNWSIRQLETQANKQKNNNEQRFWIIIQRLSCFNNRIITIQPPLPTPQKVIPC